MTLRVVTPGEEPQPRKVHTKIEDALDGSPRDVLASMRKALAKKLDAGEVSSNAIASAYKELRELDRLIRQMDAEAEDEPTRGQDGDSPDERFDSSAV